MSLRLLVCPIGGATGADAVAALKVIEVGRGHGVVVETGRERPRPASVLAPGPVKQLESDLDDPGGSTVAKARGGLVFVSVEDGDGLPGEVSRLIEKAGDLPVAVVTSPGRYRELLELDVWDEVLVRADEPERDSPLARLVIAEAAEFSDRVGTTAKAGMLESKRALAGHGAARSR